MSTTHQALRRLTDIFPRTHVCLLLVALATTSACGREPGIIVNIAAWPDRAERIRVRTTIGETRGMDIFLDREQTRFAVRVPVGSQGTVQLDADGLDAVDCKLARGSLTEPVPENLSLFVERTLELSPLPAPECGVFAGEIPIGFPAPYFVAVGDLDSDGNQDLAIANVDVPNQGVTVLLGDGGGGFGNGPKLSGFAEPRAVAVGDFNGDMKLDLAVANFGGSKVSVLLRNNQGGFDNPSDLQVDPYPQSVAVGDFNGDMNLDLVSSNGVGTQQDIGTVSVMLGNGMGGFRPALRMPVGAVGAQFVAVGDFNRDSYLDLAVANAQSSNVSVLLGIGGGAFKPATTFNVGIAPYWLAVGDFNRDSYPDLAVANYGLDDPAQSSVSVLLGNGLGKFIMPALNLVVGQRSHSLAVGDFDGDQNPDLAVANTGIMPGTGNVSLLLGNGRGGFGTPVHFMTGTSSWALAVGVFNGDRRPDLAVANRGGNTVSILLNQF